MEYCYCDCTSLVVKTIKFGFERTELSTSEAILFLALGDGKCDLEGGRGVRKGENGDW